MAKKRVKVDGQAAVIVHLGADAPLPFDWQMHQQALMLDEHKDELAAALKRIQWAFDEASGEGGGRGGLEDEHHIYGNSKRQHD